MLSGTSRKPLIKRITAAILALGIGMFSIGAVAWAMRVSPMVAELTTSGAGSTARIEVGNIGNAPLPFETLLTRMELDADGNVVETPADEDFLIFPPQGMVSVGGRQVVRVQWIGSPDLPASQAYYLWVKQLPVATTPNENGSGGSASVQVLYTMKALIVVAPDGAEPDVRLIEAIPVALSEEEIANISSKAEEGAAIPTHGIRVVVANQGRRYALMSGANWVIEGTDYSGQPFVHQFTGDQISASVGVGYLPPLNGRRTFTLPTPVALDSSKPVNVRFTR